MTSNSDNRLALINWLANTDWTIDDEYFLWVNPDNVSNWVLATENETPPGKKKVELEYFQFQKTDEDSMCAAIRSALAFEDLWFNGRIVKGINPESMYELWWLGQLNDSFSKMLEELAQEYVKQNNLRRAIDLVQSLEDGSYWEEEVEDDYDHSYDYLDYE